jgi:hypothetical protein
MRVSRATLEKRAAAAVAMARAACEWDEAFSSFTSAPVSIFTGQAAWHIESPAHVSTPS